MDSKIRIKFGELEVEFEGDAAYIKDGLLQLVKEVAQLLGNQAQGEKPIDAADSIPSTKEPSTNKSANSGEQLDMSTASIMTKIRGNGASDLAVAAAAYLTFVSQRPTFSRTELLEEMKSATSFYTESMSSNLTKTLGRLVKDKFVQKGNGSYAIQNATRTQIEAQLFAD